MFEIFTAWWGKDSSRSIPFLILLFVPFALGWFATEGVLTKTGLVSRVFVEKPKALEIIQGYAQKVQEAVGTPVITATTYQNGNKEKRLIVRTMNDEDVVSEVVTPFAFPAAMGLLFGAWCFTVCLHQFSAVRTSVKTNAFRILLVVNVIAIGIYFGFARSAETIFK